QEQLETMLRAAPVVAVVVIEDAKDAVPLARALVAGGIKAIEITLRTPAALDAIRAISSEVEGAIAGAGTLLTPADFAAAERAGAGARRTVGRNRKPGARGGGVARRLIAIAASCCTGTR